MDKKQNHKLMKEYFLKKFGNNFNLYKKCSCGENNNINNITIISNANDEIGLWYDCNKCGSSHLILWRDVNKKN